MSIQLRACEKCGRRYQVGRGHRCPPPVGMPPQSDWPERLAPALRSVGIAASAIVLSGLFLAGLFFPPLLLWLVFALVAMAIGASKGEAFVGFVAGFMLGPFGVLAMVLGRGNLKDCPHCAKRVAPTATACPYCTRDLRQPTAGNGAHGSQAVAGRGRQ